MKYLLIAKRHWPRKGGAYTVSKLLAKKFPQYIELHKEGQPWDDQDQYKKIIFVTQVPYLYSLPVNIVRLKDINHLIFIRDEYNHPLFNSCTNGFWYYKEHKNIENYMPFIPDMSHIKPHNPDIPCYGFNSRPFRTPDSFKKCMEIFLNLPHEVDVCTMGKAQPYIQNFKNVRHYHHFHNNEKFFQKITHFIYPASNKFVDPFPTSLCEAVQAGKEIIIPKLKERLFKDGINDICDVIQQDRHLLDFRNFEKFYIQLFENDFEYSFNRNKYKSFGDWICQIK